MLIPQELQLSPTFFERQNESNKKAPKTIYLGAF